MSTELARILREQRECRDYILSGQPDQRGANQGLDDWTAEEVLLRYEEFLKAKQQYGAEGGFKPIWTPDFLFDFQLSLVEWAIRKGRAAILADCGLGKTLLELVWAENVVRHTNRQVLLLTPLAVASQTVREGEKFGIGCTRSSDGKFRKCDKIIVTNYERLHYFNPNDFSGVVCDESSAIKAFNGKRRAEVTEFLRTVPYRLLCTATPAPNDYIELGTSSEALGVMGQIEMLNRFFKNDQNNSDARLSRKHNSGRHSNGWRFKGHAELPFMQWVCSWARACRRPSDLGFPDGRFILPPLIEQEHIVDTRTLAPGMLFPFAASNRAEELEERRRTIPERCEKAAELVSDTGQPFVVWCHLNPEGDLLEKLIPDAVQIAGVDPDEKKEEAYEAFASGQSRGIVTKHKIGAWGLNWQHCAHVVEFADHSFEQHYQGVRRCWRFGQLKRVVNDIIATEGQRGLKENMARKSAAADRMFTLLVEQMNRAMRLDAGYRFTEKEMAPEWL